VKIEPVRSGGILPHLPAEDGGADREEALKKVFTPLVCCTVRSDNKRSADLFLKNSFDIMGTFRNSMTDREIFLMVGNLQQKE